MIVNTVFQDLALNKGAVSNAIFAAAGPKLQQLVSSQKSNGTFGDIIVTDSCKLKSKQVFHAVSPSWDKGQGTAEKVSLTLCLNRVVKCIHRENLLQM